MISEATSLLGALPTDKLSSVINVTCHKKLKKIVKHINFETQYFASFIVVDIGFKVLLK